MIPELKNKLKGKVLIVGMGNPMRGDDGLGPELIRRLELRELSSEKTFSSSFSQPSTLNSKLSFLDVGEVPENYLGKIIKEKPDVILFVDAIDFGDVPGNIKIIDIDTLREDGLTTHNASLKLTMEYLKKETEASMFLLGIQPQNLKLGSDISKPVNQAIKLIKEYLIKCMN